VGRGGVLKKQRFAAREPFLYATRKTERMRPFVLGVLVLSLAALTLAHTGTYESGTQGLHATVQTAPEPLEPGTITLTTLLTEDGVPLANESVQMRVMLGKRLVLDTTSVTNQEGMLEVAFFVESAGYYDVSYTAREQTVTTQVHVHGRMILVIGFLVALAILLAILLDRL
jgi:hypothetical protein